MRATFAWSASETRALCASLRLVLVSFDVRIWRILDWPRLILPVPVFLKRLAAPRCVFSLGMVYLWSPVVWRHEPVYGKAGGQAKPLSPTSLPLKMASRPGTHASGTSGTKDV